MDFITMNMKYIDLARNLASIAYWTTWTAVGVEAIRTLRHWR